MRYHDLIRPAWVEINLAALQHNLKEIQRLVGPAVDIMAVVKAEGYGHGAAVVAKTAIASGASWLGVSLPEEGISLREAGIHAPILIFGPLQIDQVKPIVKYDLTATICSLDSIAALSKEAVHSGKTANVHLKIDTGMGRVGIQPHEAVSFMNKIIGFPGIKVSGVFSHLATADENDKNYAHQQIKIFTETIEALKTEAILPPKVHMANSAAIIDLPTSYFNMVRPGLMLYGLYPSADVQHEKIRLEPVLSLKAKVTFVKRVARGTGISYGQKYHTKSETTIATIPIGYADGWSRLLSHKAQVIIGGKKYPVVGTICMDQCMVDLGDDPVAVGQEVVLLGKMGQSEITADAIATHLGTINYEVTCMLSDRLPRVYINECNPKKDLYEIPLARS